MKIKQISKTISKKFWLDILNDNNINNPKSKRELLNEKDLKILQIMYMSPNYLSSAHRLAIINGSPIRSDKDYKTSANTYMVAWVRRAKTISKKYDIKLKKNEDKSDECFSLFFNWTYSENEGKYVWKLKKELAEALSIVLKKYNFKFISKKDYKRGIERYKKELEIISKYKLRDLKIDYYNPDEIEGEFNEGTGKRVYVNIFERNSKAREICIKKYGAVCNVCNFDFKKVYGKIGDGFIHVHHIKPISEIGKNYKVDPIKDLIPLCPNCHAMIHRTKESLSVEELKNQIIKKK